jgi:hypothetical protein
VDSGIRGLDTLSTSPGAAVSSRQTPSQAKATVPSPAQDSDPISAGADVHVRVAPVASVATSMSAGPF